MTTTTTKKKLGSKTRGLAITVRWGKYNKSGKQIQAERMRQVM
jgi:hypothetical protein